MLYPQTYQTDKGPVTVLAFDKFRLNDQYCYRIVLTGAIDAFFGVKAVILERRDQQDGSAVIAYQPGDVLYQIASKLDRLGAWPANSEVL